MEIYQVLYTKIEECEGGHYAPYVNHEKELFVNNKELARIKALEMVIEINKEILSDNEDLDNEQPLLSETSENKWKSTTKEEEHYVGVHLINVLSE